jgi:hypothetical protein
MPWMARDKLQRQPRRVVCDTETDWMFQPEEQEREREQEREMEIEGKAMTMAPCANGRRPQEKASSPRTRIAKVAFLSIRSHVFLGSVEMMCMHFTTGRRLTSSKLEKRVRFEGRML